MVNVNCGACGHLNSRGYCSLTACIFPCSFGTSGHINKPITNYDLLRAMSVEEMAEFLLNRDLDVVEKASKAVGFTYKVDRESCLVNVIDWLKSGLIRLHGDL